MNNAQPHIGNNTDKFWFFDIDSWLKESKILFLRINEISDYTIKKDLLIIYRNIDKLSIEIMREQNRCKIHQFQSENHKKLIDKFNECKQILLEQLTYGLLTI